MNSYKEIRDKFGMNQSQFADALGVEQSTVSRWEADLLIPSGRNIKAMIALGRDRGIDVADLALGAAA